MKLMTSIVLTAVALVGLPLCAVAAPTANAGMASHCRADEFAYLNAAMKTTQRRKDGGYDMSPTGKVLSICADRQAEPLRALAYRYGRIGAVEFERVATPAGKFTIFDRTDTPHSGSNIVFFKVGNNTFCIMEATAQGSGVSLSVLRSGRVALDLFSGNERGVDFESGLFDIDFSQAKSPIFSHYDGDPDKTPCDAASGK